MEPTLLYFLQSRHRQALVRSDIMAAHLPSRWSAEVRPRVRSAVRMFSANASRRARQATTTVAFQRQTITTEVFFIQRYHRFYTAIIVWTFVFDQNENDIWSHLVIFFLLSNFMNRSLLQKYIRFRSSKRFLMFGNRLIHFFFALI